MKNAKNVKSASKSFAIQTNPVRHINLGNEKYGNIDTLIHAHTPFWLHFDQPSKHLQHQLIKKLELSKTVRRILFAEEQRPRCIKVDSGFLLIVQGIQPSNIALQEEPPALKLWITSGKLLSISTGKIDAINDMQAAISGLDNPDLMACLATLLEYLIWYIEEATYQLDERLDKIETGIEHIDQSILSITEVRQCIVRFRRYVIPQRDAVILLSNKIDLVSGEPITVMKELSESMMRQAEMLEMLRERAAIVQDSLSNQIGELANRRMYLLTIIMLVFTPAFFVMGLFSMYLPIPGMNSRFTWWVVLLFIIVSSIGLLALFRKKRWL